MRVLILLGAVPVLAVAATTTGLPLSFEPAPSGYFARLGSHTVRLAPEGISLRSGRQTFWMRFPGANPASALEALDPLPGKSNYIVGRDPARWVTGVPTYARIRYRRLYPGIDLICHGSAGALEYDFEVRPGADPARIRLSFGREYAAHLDRNGDLVLSLGASAWRHHAPRVYQGSREIAGRYIILPRGEFGFAVGAYDRSQPLLIDPIVTQVTYLGGTRSDAITAVAVDAAGNIYLTGYTNSTDFPVTGGAYGSQYTGGACPIEVQLPGGEGPPVYQEQDTWCVNAFVTKLNPSGTALIYSTYVGGSGNAEPEGGDKPAALAADGQGNVYVAGTTSSIDFPVTANALQESNPGNAEFLFQLDASGARLLYSTYIGVNIIDTYASDYITGIAVSSAGYLYVAGTTTDENFPVLRAIQPQFNKGDCNDLIYYNGGGPICSYAFLMQWRVPDMTLQYSTFLGGSSDDAANGVAADAAGNAYLTGLTTSTDFPLVNPIQSVPPGGPCLVSATVEPPACADAFVAKIDAAGTKIVYSTLLGGPGANIATGIAVDGQGNAYVTGNTSSASFPVADAFQSGPGGGTCYTPHGGPVPCDDVFVTKINPQGSAFIYSTYLGGAGENEAQAIAVDASGNAYVAGNSGAYAGFPITHDALIHCNGTGGANFLTQLTPAGTLAYSTFIKGGAGLAVGSPGHVYFANNSGPVGLPVSSSAPLTTFGNQYHYVAMLDLTAPSFSGPIIDGNCVVNAAGYNAVASSGAPVPAIAPGEIVALFGSGLGPTVGVSATLDSHGNFPTSLGGVTVVVNSVAAPLLYVSANQVNAIIPFTFPESGAATVTLSYLGNSSINGVSVGLVQGIFTSNANGAGQAAALNQDGSLNSPSNPAARGSIVSIWATGLGPTNPSFPDGQITPQIQAPLVTQPVIFVHDAGTPAQILYAGQAPGLVAGAVQINFVVPDTAPTGPAIPVNINYLDYNETQPPTIAIK